MDTKIIKDMSAFIGCRRLFNELYKDERFKNIMDTEGRLLLSRGRDGSVFHIDGIYLEYGYVENFFEKEGFDISDIDSIILPEIFKYRDNMSYLYVNGYSRLEGDTLIPCVNPNKDYPCMKDVLANKDNFSEWLVAKPSNFFVTRLNNMNSHFKVSKNPGMFRVHMVDGILTLSAYGVGHSRLDFPYGKDKKLDALLEDIIEVTYRFSFDVKEIYWFINGSYTKTNARKNDDGEVTLVIS